ncbi:MAG: thiamine diphosphokinase [Oscillospiraceae bacterium]|nr:thiamine diphosphokinase [Oscillospiraceae bacterium]
MTEKRSCWIFGGAPVSVDYKIIPPSDAYLIAADSGFSMLKRMGIMPDLVLGDFDSLTDDKPTDCEILTAAVEKDDTDTMLAIKTALSRGYLDITIAGSIGGRLDHTFANIQSLAYIVENGGSGRLVGENDTCELFRAGDYKFPKNEKMHFSLFSYSEEAVITTRGTKYDLDSYCLTNSFPLGVSNEILLPECTLKIEKGRVLVIFSKK